MGCQTSNVLDFRANAEAKIVGNSPNSKSQSVQALIDKQKSEFPDMEEWEGDRYKGIGIKRMKGYKCDLRVINQACVYDEYRANVLMEEYNLTTFEGCINHIVDKYGIHYIIPNYCINDPYFEKEFKVDENVKKVDLKLNLYEVATNTNTTINTNNLINGEELKKIFCEKNNISMDDYNIRMFFAGGEILNDHFVYQYNIKNDYKIQVMKVPKKSE